MNILTTRVIAASLGVILSATPLLREPSSSGTEVTTFNQSRTVTTVSLADLKQPHLLALRAEPTVRQLSGRVELNGELLAPITSKQFKLNLSPWLSPGRNVLTISGKYLPALAEVEMELRGVHTLVRHRTGGSGSLNQTLIIEVKE